MAWNVLKTKPLTFFKEIILLLENFVLSLEHQKQKIIGRRK